MEAKKRTGTVKKVTKKTTGKVRAVKKKVARQSDAKKLGGKVTKAKV